MMVCFMQGISLTVGNLYLESMLSVTHSDCYTNELDILYVQQVCFEQLLKLGDMTLSDID